MAELIIEVPDELEERIKAFPNVNWMEVERKAIEFKLFELELKTSRQLGLLLLRALTQKSKLSEEEADEFAIELGRKIKKDRFKHLKSMGVV